MKRFWQLSIAITLLACGQAASAGGASAVAEPLSLAAAPSLKAPFEEILPIFEVEYGVPLRVQYGPSYTLRRQIEQGAPIDVFLPESWQDVETLHQKGLTRLGGPRQYAQSSLVLVMSSASAATAISFSEASAKGALRVALVDPKASSVGLIAFRALKDIAPLLQHRPHFLSAPSTDDVIRLVSAGEADVGVVYRADAINSGQVRIIDEAPAGRSIPVVFGQTVVSTCRETSLPAAEQFVNFMMSPRIQKLLLKYGFDAIPTKATTVG
ncbi:MAG TPA: molybdate ABC transporter substrate-binding protein [Nitrospira sp.]|jgi:molybdate transport system substrate-binding protein|nr:molybdate ABC transporter substrate-binding protein [Nitrospira sp.]